MVFSLGFSDATDLKTTTAHGIFSPVAEKATAGRNSFFF